MRPSPAARVLEAMPSLDPGLVAGPEEIAPDVLGKIAIAEPALAHFQKDGHDLWYASPLHVEKEESPGFQMLRRAFERFPIGDVVVEGSPYSRGEFKGSCLEAVLRRNEKGLYENGERGYAAKLASERGISVIGGEPSDRELAAELLRRGHEPRDVLGLGFVCYIPQWTRLGALESDAPGRLFEREMPGIRKQHGLQSAPRFAYRDFLLWYRERNGEAFEPLVVAGGEPMRPLKDGPMGTQRLFHAATLLRNQTIARVLNERLRLKRRVLAVFGNGHLACHWSALLAAFGEPVYYGSLQDSAPKRRAAPDIGPPPWSGRARRR